MKSLKALLVLVLSVLLLATLSGCKAGSPSAPQETAAPEPQAAQEPLVERTAEKYDYIEPAGFEMDLSDLKLKASDGSSISFLPTKPGEDVTQRSQEEYLTALVEGYSKTYPDLEAADVSIEEYERIETNGLPCLHALYRLTPSGGEQHVLERTVIAGETAYRVRYVDLSGSDAWLDIFRRSGDTIYVVWEDETDAPDKTKLVLYDADGLYVGMKRGMESGAQQGFHSFYSSDDCAMFVTRESFEDYEAAGMDTEAFTLEEYAELVRQANAMTVSFEPDSFGHPAATYTTDVNGRDFFYYVTVRKGPNAFWVVNFACPDNLRDEYLPQFELWADTIMV